MTTVAIACQGGGSHTAFTAGVLGRLFDEPPADHEFVALSGTSGGAVCALLAWYALRRGDPGCAGALLEGFWADNSATTPWEQLLNASAMFTGELAQYVALPAISPYDNPLSSAAAERFLAMLRRRVEFETLTPADRPPLLVVGAVDVLSGAFRAFDSRRDAITPETILASAAIPTLFESVRVDGGTYWDGLFSQNPPIRNLIDAAPDEIWVIQINPTQRATEPRTVPEIADRRNELAGNLSLYQELHFIEKIDELLEAGVLAPEAPYRPIVVRVIELSPQRLGRPLGVHSKLNRDPSFIADLIDHGRARAQEFLTALEIERAWRARDVGALVQRLADDVALHCEPPFPSVAPTAGRDAATAFIRDQLSRLALDLTHKQVAMDAVTWSVRLEASEAGGGGPAAPGAGDGGPAARGRPRGRASITLRDGLITALALGPDEP